MELVRKLCDFVPAEDRPKCTLYTSTEPCVMCAGAIYWSQVGRVVFGCSAHNLEQTLSGPGGFDIPIRQLFATGGDPVSVAGRHPIEVVGPLLEDCAIKVHTESGCWPGVASADIDTEKSLFTSGLGAAPARRDEGAVKVPVIDMSVGRSEESIADDLFAAATTVGFFTVMNHGIPQEWIDQAFEASQLFFIQDQASKAAQAPFARNLNSGYEYFSQVRPSTGTADQKETIQITAREGSMEGRWPTSPDNFQEAATTLLEASDLLAKRILTMLQDKACPHLGPDKKGLIANSHNLWSPAGQCTLRLLHYPPMKLDDLRQLTTPDEEGRIHWRAGPHTDWDNVTLLYQRPNQAGLECCANPKSVGDKYWVPVDPVVGGIAVNIGDMLARWSNGLLYSNLHRVRMPLEEDCDNSRYSIAYFAQSDKPVVIESDSGEITAGDYILSRIQSNFAK
jgi:isopenicillin N synthase-like dioxygenase